mmetsp:Transcript_29654/g.45346  ORF Transcript_29654/g.45346 Transcript_29654/m.45346 type:complete len:594 (+) Transcript_29654:114-1895(+)
MSSSPYHAAGKLMTEILLSKKSLKTLAFKKSRLVCTKATYAQVCNTIQYKSKIDKILNHDSGRLRKSIEMDKARHPGLMYILLFELLFGKYLGIRGGGQLKRKIVKFEKDLREVRDSIIGKDEMPIPVFPRYIRVNKLKASSEEVISELQKELMQLDVGSDIYMDAHVPDLLVLRPKLSLPWHDLDLLKSGKIILQDKSSCFSALALVLGNTESLDGDFIDACAAPGNKTSHLAAMIYDQLKKKSPKKKAKVFCFDRSIARLAILKDRMSQLAPLVSDGKGTSKNKFPVDVCPTLQDFLKADPQDKTFRQVKSILLDPSCSGSGIINQPDRSADDNSNGEKERLVSLSNFQLVALKHAMSFPQVERIVYSTCSVNEIENENVVATALKECNEEVEDEELKWKLVSPVSLGYWPRRGFSHKNLTDEESKCLIRVNGVDGDCTNGFFVGYFERREATSNAEVKEIPSFVCAIKGAKGIYDGEFGSAISVKNEDGDKKKGMHDQKKGQKSNQIIAKGKKNIQEKEQKSNQQKGKKEVGVGKGKKGERKIVEDEIPIQKSENSPKFIPKKKQKKMDWKKRMKEQKLARVMKKNAGKA